MTYAVGCLNPFFNLCIFVKQIGPDGVITFTKPVNPDVETIADALLMPEPKARLCLRRLPRFGFLIACSEADQNGIRATNTSSLT